MEATIFADIVEKFFSRTVGAITERYNGATAEPQLLCKTMLTEEYSADLNWGATELNNAIVAADVVALDSSLPLKMRGKVSNASGALPKIGIKYRRGEKSISDINVMIARGASSADIAAKILDDASKAIKAIAVREEIMFEQALSTGEVLIEGDDNHDGLGVRASFGYDSDNFFKCTGAKWVDDTANASSPKAVDDVRQLFDKAQEDGNPVAKVLMSKKYFNALRNSEQGKLLAASFNGAIVKANTVLTTPSRQTMLDALEDEFGAKFQIVDASFKVEKLDGTSESVTPWTQANVVAVPSETVGRLVYGTLAEETNPVANVTYEKSGTHVLVSKYSKTDPLEEFTAAQALCIPVIDGGKSIYVLKADEVKAKNDND